MANTNNDIVPRLKVRVLTQSGTVRVKLPNTPNRLGVDIPLPKDVTTDAVLYTPQTLSESEQSVARNNVGITDEMYYKIEHIGSVYHFEDGLNNDNDTITVKIDPKSDKDINGNDLLTVSPDGVKFSGTLYESKSAVEGGTDVSLVTTGDKYAWNGKQNALDSQTAYTNAGASNKVPKVTTNALGQVTNIEEVDIDEKLGTPVTAVVGCGGITVGTTLTAETTFHDFVDRLLNPVLYPTWTDPSVTMTAYSTTLYAIGSTVAARSIGLTFDTGEITLNGVKQNNRAGDANKYKVATSGAATEKSVEVESNASSYSLSMPTFTRATKGNVIVTGTVYYDEGAQPIDSSGANYETPLATGSVSASQTLEFIVPFYYGVSNTSTISSLTGLSTSVQKKGTRTFNFNQNNQYAVVAYDSTYGSLSKITEVSTGYNVTSSWQKYTTIDNFIYYIQKVPQTTGGNVSFTFQF